MEYCQEKRLENDQVPLLYRSERQVESKIKRLKRDERKKCS